MNSQESLTWLRADDMPGTELFSILNSTVNFALFHERYSVCALESVAATGRYRNQSILLPPGSLCLFEPGESHTTPTVHQGGNAKVVFFEPALFEQTALELGQHLPIHWRLQKAGHLEPRLFTAIQCLAASIAGRQPPLAQQTWQSLCIRRLLAFSERWQPLARTRGAWTDRLAVKQAMACLQDRYNEPVQLRELADLTGLSPFVLIRNFTMWVGMPPHAYQIHVRVERARAMLARGVHPGLVAAATGFSDQSHLSRLFKRVMGMTPGAYARSSRSLPEHRLP